MFRDYLLFRNKSSQFFSEENEAEVLKDAKRKLDDIRCRLWFYVAKELEHGDPYLFLRAYTAGMIDNF